MCYNETGFLTPHLHEKLSKKPSVAYSQRGKYILEVIVRNIKYVKVNKVY